MYLNHFHFCEKPFKMAADPKFIWLSEKHSEALATLEYGIQEDKGFLLLTGIAGAGKTVIIESLLKRMADNILPATIPGSVPDYQGILNILSLEFKMNRAFDSKGDFLICFKKFLHSAYRERKKIVLIIDAAQEISDELLEEIRLLSNIELEDAKLINIIFVGQREFYTILSKDCNIALRQGIGIRYHLNLLDDLDTAAYINHRLKAAGSDQEIFSSNALEKIHFLSSGSPRLINIICDCALSEGYSSGLKKIDKRVIEKCVQEINLPDVSPGIKPEKMNCAENDEQVSYHKQQRISWIKFNLAVTIFCLLAIGALVVYSVYFNQSLSSTITKDAYQHYKRFEKQIDRVKKDRSLAVEVPRDMLLKKKQIQKGIKTDKDL